MTASDAISAILYIPAFAAALLAILPGYRLTARLNVLASLLTFLSAALATPVDATRVAERHMESAFDMFVGNLL